MVRRKQGPASSELQLGRNGNACQERRQNSAKKDDCMREEATGAESQGTTVGAQYETGPEDLPPSVLKLFKKLPPAGKRVP